MEIKKAPEADLENKRSAWLLMGYVVALSLLFIALEWNVRDDGDDTDRMSQMPVYEQEIEIPVTYAPPKPPAPPPLSQEQPAATVLTVLDNRSEEEEIPLVLPEAVEGNGDGIPADESAVEGTATEETVYDVVERMPEFPDGGLAGLMRYLTRHIRYPRVALANRIQGQVLIQFIVNRDGSIADVRVLQGVHATLDGEATRVLSQMPRWKPGIRHGQPVRVRYTIPVVFRL